MTKRNLNIVRWGMIGCGSVAEVKAGPALQKATASSLVAVTSRTVAKARDYAERHGVARVHTTAADLIADRDVDAIYIATPPESHCELALAVAAGRKACLVEKPMALTHAECARMVAAFEDAGCPLWVAYYRRALPRYLLVRDLLRDETIGWVTSLQIEVFETLASPDRATSWRFDPAIGGGGLFFDLGSHTLDMVDFLVGPIDDLHAVALNTGGAYRAEDAVTASFRAGPNVCGTGVWNFNADRTVDRITLVGTRGSVVFPMFREGDVVLSRITDDRFSRPNPPHVHQPLIQTIVDELRGNGRCDATAVSAARTAAVLDRCVAGYYASR